MRWVLLLLAVAAPGGAFAQTMTPAAPVAVRRPHQVVAPFGAVRDDPYYWLRDDTRKNPEMLGYLAAENRYADAQLAKTKPLQDKLYTEIVGRIRQDDSSVPYRRNGYYYYSRFATGADYPVVARRKGAMSAPEEVMLDEPAMAAGKGYFQAAGAEVSPDNRLLAYAEDDVGRRQYVLKVKDLASGVVMADSVANVEPGLVWSGDSRTVFYVEKDPVTLLSKRVRAHVLGTPASADRVVYQEADDSFYLGLLRTSDDRYICIALQSTVSNEQRCAAAADPTTFTIVAPREREFRYESDHAGGRWVIRTNWQAPDYRLMTAADADLGKGRGAWSTLVPARAGVFIDGFHPFDRFVAIEERVDGNKRLRLLANGGGGRVVAADDPAYAIDLDVNAETDATAVRYRYTSLLTPTTTFEVDVATGERRVLKVQPTPGYDKANYVTERVWATARDGTRVPVSLFYRKGLKRDGTAPLFQYAYGSYGISSDPAWTNYAVSLADRGVVYALAHIRGGQELGRHWYDDGHLMNKKHSFTDFVDVTRWLTAHRYAAPGRAAALGGSAGGLLMGAVANIAPQDYRAIIAQVPFVDVVTTMLDASIPLTTNEYDEWGNPASKPAYDYMLSYSPYDNVRAQPYPAMFVGTGLWDSQVQYYEPTKWVAKLRAADTGTAPIVFRINMEAGHGGKSGRFRRYRDEAEYLAFALDQLKAD